MQPYRSFLKASLISASSLILVASAHAQTAAGASVTVGAGAQFQTETAADTGEGPEVRANQNAQARADISAGGNAGTQETGDATAISGNATRVGGDLAGRISAGASKSTGAAGEQPERANGQAQSHLRAGAEYAQSAVVTVGDQNRYPDARRSGQDSKCSG